MSKKMSQSQGKVWVRERKRKKCQKTTQKSNKIRDIEREMFNFKVYETKIKNIKRFR